jgi:hypothetical protein
VIDKALFQIPYETSGIILSLSTNFDLLKLESSSAKALPNYDFRSGVKLFGKL